MSRITVPPNYLGTPLPDLVIGTESSASGGIGILILAGGVIDTLEGNDAISGSGSGKTGENIGIKNSGTIITGEGDDSIYGSATLSSSTGSVGAVGIKNQDGSTINLGAGNDSIYGSAIISSSTGSGAALGFINDGSTINLGAGNDVILGYATSNLSGFGTNGINTKGTIEGGAGNDIISGYCTSTQTNSTGIDNYSLVSGGDGNDVISGYGQGKNQGWGLLDWNPPEPGPGMISGGKGNDSITGIGISENPSGNGIGIINELFGWKGLIDGGPGNDTITGYGTRVGIQDGTIVGGCGCDTFKARRVDQNVNPIANQDGAISNVIIKGDSGNDKFNVGFGTATLNGGAGIDRLILPVLAGGTYTKTTLGGGLFEITNSASSNVLTISSIEQITPFI
jgi:Ca2+-binding RTX toxin-like protein